MKLEEEWDKEKEARRANQTMADHRGPRNYKRKIIRALIGLAVVGALVGGAVFALKKFGGGKSDEAPHHEKVLPGGAGTVSIEIRSKPPMAIRIDGNRAGTTPITLHVPKHGQLLMIEATARGKDPQYKQVTADHDQTVDFQ